VIIVVWLYNITDAITELNNLKHNNTVINQPIHKPSSSKKQLKKSFFLCTRKKDENNKREREFWSVFASDLSITRSYRKINHHKKSS